MNKHPLVVAITPQSDRLAIAVFCGEHLTYYKLSARSQKQNRFAKACSLTKHLIKEYQPDYLVIESPVYVQQQTKALLAVYEAIAKTAKRFGTKMILYSPVEVRTSFSPFENTNKFKVAEILVKLYPELNSYLNYDRKTPQAHGMLIFNAVALGLFAVRTDFHKPSKTMTNDKIQC
jgi:Holliday junction resolvasome RuvABC endonuclease subunit